MYDNTPDRPYGRNNFVRTQKFKVEKRPRGLRPVDIFDIAVCVVAVVGAGVYVAVQYFWGVFG